MIVESSLFFLAAVAFLAYLTVRVTLTPQPGDTVVVVVVELFVAQNFIRCLFVPSKRISSMHTLLTDVLATALTSAVFLSFALPVMCLARGKNCLLLSSKHNAGPIQTYVCGRSIADVERGLQAATCKAKQASDRSSLSHQNPCQPAQDLCTSVGLGYLLL